MQQGDQTLIRQALVALLQLSPDIQVVGEAADGPTAVGLVGQTRPDVVLMDVQLSASGASSDGITTTAAVGGDAEDLGLALGQR